MKDKVVRLFKKLTPRIPFLKTQAAREFRRLPYEMKLAQVLHFALSCAQSKINPAGCPEYLIEYECFLKEMIDWIVWQLKKEGHIDNENLPWY